MKTLIMNGSPRINGNTASLLEIIKENIDGEYRIIDTYRCSISPCLDCRFCWENNGCIIDDEMQEIYDYIQNCYNIHDVVFSHNTNVTPAIEDKQAVNGIHSIIDFFNNV